MHQINLYQPILRQQKRIFSARTLGATLLLVAVMLGAIDLYGQVQVRGLGVEAKALENSRNVAEFRLRELKIRLPKRHPDARLEAEVVVLQAAAQQAARLAETLSSGALGNTGGLSEYLVALARQHVDGTALTRIEVAAGGSAIGLGGVARAPELVPEYIERLRLEKVFNGRVFNQLSLNRADSGIEFRLTTPGTSLSRKEDANAGR